MTADPLFGRTFSRKELALFDRLSSPFKIQKFLLSLPYSPEERYRCPKTVLRDRIAHCFDGALFAAAALRHIGYPPLIVDMLPNQRDDDHIVAVYRIKGHWGGVAKSNFAGLTFREPIHRTLRELMLSYFEQFYNIRGEKTLRAFTVPLDLRLFDRINWMGDDAGLDAIGVRLDRIRKIRLLTPAMIRRLSRLDDRSYRAGLTGADPKGLYKP